ncbi:MAG: glycosyltransferase family 4 protein [Methanobacterium sp.]|jgi:glycosyltransferase involved in cell wall biosynthesis|nr:glycosyltransferase family 4 protein [Methanobacterium sp.]
MKIAYIYDAVYPWVTGGAEKRVYELARRMVQEGHEVHWYSWGWWWPEKGKKDITFEGIHLHGVGQPYELYTDNRRSIKEALLFAVKLLPVLMKEDYDIVDCQGFPFFSCFSAKIHSLLGKSKLIITVHEVWGDYWYQYLGPIGFFGKLVESIMFRLTNRLIAVSEKTLTDLGKIRNTNESKVIANGINFKEIMNADPVHRKWQVVYAGRITKEKRVDLLINALGEVRDEIPDISALIIGEGPDISRIKKMVDDLNLNDNITFLGFMDDYYDLISYLKSSEVFVLASEREGFGIVVLEANASGLPVVVVKSPLNAAIDLISEGENGFVAQANVSDVKNKIIAALRNKDEMKKHSQNIAKKYDWDDITPLLEEFYQESLP